MGSSLVPHVRASNALTGRWCATFGGEDAVVSGAGLWPLLAVLAGAASGRARDELAAAVGIAADQAHAAGLALLKSLDTSREVSTAIGAWVRAGLTLREEWVRSMPAGTVGELGDPAAINLTGVPRKTWSTITAVVIDRPFGFLAVDRPTGLVLVAGQVTKPPVEWTRPVRDEPTAARNPGAPW
ncbi:hypothetical protein AB0M13_16145 [Nocardia fluminea]|uniref:hypothetical protein n=1 Tax=Nocardia fluminea TaxID=134984 RepID=UPI00341B97CB